MKENQGYQHLRSFSSPFFQQNQVFFESQMRRRN
jgi:hypothetical protein